MPGLTTQQLTQMGITPDIQSSPQGITTAQLDQKGITPDVAITTTQQPNSSGFLHPLDALSNQYNNAVATATEGVKAGSKTMQKGGAANIVHGAVQAGLGAAAATTGSVFAPFAASADAIIPQGNSTLGKFASDTAKGAIVGAELGTVVPVAGTLVGGAIGGLFGAGMSVVNDVKNAIFEHTKISEPDKAMINNALNVGLAIIGEKVGENSTGSKGLNTDISDITQQSVKANLPSVPQPTPQQVEAQAAQAQADLQQKAIQDATPAYSKSMLSEPHITNADGSTNPRVTPGTGLTGKQTVNPTPSEIESGIELSKVPGYDPDASSLENLNVVKSDIATKGQALDTSLKNETVVRPPDQVMNVIKGAVTKAADESLLLQKTDPIVKNYLRVAQNAILQAPDTLAGERSVEKALDNAYESAGGRYGNNKALDQIHLASRTALIEDMETNAQNTQVKEALKQMSNLYNVSDVLQDKAASEGDSKLAQLKKANPTTAKIVQKGVNMVGLGGIIDLIDH